jgi:transcriptional regulator with XRE-family HTH domain
LSREKSTILTFFIKKAEMIAMYSKFWDNVRERLKDRKDGQKWLAGKSGVGRTAINNGISKAIKPKQEGKTVKNSPSVDNAYAIARVFGITIEELVDGEVGAEYVRQWARKQGGLWEPPPRLAGVMAILNGLADDELAVVTGAMRGAVQGLDDAKKGDKKRSTMTDGLAG